MNKIKMFSIRGRTEESEKTINDFISDKKVIKIAVTSKSDNYYGMIIILYEEVTN